MTLTDEQLLKLTMDIAAAAVAALSFLIASAGGVL